VRGVDRTLPEFAESEADDFVLGDLRAPIFCKDVIAQPYDEVYQLAAEIGGAEYTYVGVNDLNILLSSAQINLNVLQACQRSSVRRVFFSSSACVYPERNQLNSLEPNCAEGTAYPAEPDSEYGWEKLFSERLFTALGRSSDIATRIARYHNIFGPEGTWKAAGRKRRLRSAVKSRWLGMAALLISSATANRAVPSSIFRNVSKGPCA
jgi:nucleoside-diphosphate-sugar epimerase